MTAEFKCCFEWRRFEHLFKVPRYPRTRCPDRGVAMLISAVGKLRFGAARGPPNWIPDRDGPWSGGYWLECDDDKCIICDEVSPGLTEGAACAIEIGDDASRVCVPLPSNYAEAIARQGMERKRIEQAKQLRDILRPTLTAAAIFAAAFLFYSNAPEPSAFEATERCERLISGSIEAADREGAQKWLSTCDLSGDDAERLLERQWQERWPAEGGGAPRLVRGWPEQ